MLMNIQWESEDGARLILDLDDDLIAAEDALVQIPDKPGIYMWKLKPVSDWKTRPWSSFFDHLDKRLQAPIAEHGAYQKGRLNTLGWEIRGSAIPQSKREKLDEETENLHSKRDFFVSFLQSMNQHVPALYVGQAANLRTRTKQHLENNDHGGFGQEINNHAELDFKDLELFYCVLEEDFTRLFGDTDQVVRETLEWIATMVTLAGYTRRAG